ncbi:hypothetical protein CEXT_668071, partial [Caerostris extrusa]
VLMAFDAEPEKHLQTNFASTTKMNVGPTSVKKNSGDRGGEAIDG